MRHVLQAFLALSLTIATGCGRTTPAPAPAKDGNQAVQEPGAVKIPLAAQVVANPQDPGDPSPPRPGAAVGPAATENDKYEAALTDGLVHMADQKWAEALASFEAAQRVNDNEFVRGEIAKLRLRVEQESAAQKTVGDIEKVLDEGNAQEAAKLARQALREYGDGDASAQLVKLRLQADALQNAAAKEDAADRARRYRDEGEAALREQNLRAAALAFEQALQARADAGLQEQLDNIRGRLQQYDALRRRAAELRRDPQQLEDALAALNDAVKAWDTLQLRQEIDECNLALQKRRDNLSVADFEVRGDAGFADAGRTIAEELLPHFKARFDLVERGQINKVIEELKLEDSFADDQDDQREVSRLAKVRYLVVGSVSPLAGVTVSARLVDARSGLVVQTGKIAAPTLEQAVARLPLLARQLLMTDEEKLAFDAEQALLAKRITPPPDDAPLPAPPPAPVAGVAPPPQVVFEAPAPPPFLGVTFEHYRRLPPPPAVIVNLPPPPPPAPLLRHRMLHASLALGDDDFRHGRYAQAQRHFDFALNLSPGNFDLRLRLERVRPLLPPPVVVVQPVAAPVVFARPRVAVLDFGTFGDPRVVPPGLGPWTARQLAPYYRARYDVIDPAHVYWHMGRMGMTMRDLFDDPHARRWLARAVGVRYFVVGALVETASFNIHAYLLDAEFGFVQGAGSVHVHNRFEAKLRLGELAQMTMLDPVERARLLAEADRFNALVLRGRQCIDRRDFTVAVGVFEDALRLRPGHVEVMFHLTNSRRQAEIFALEEARRQQYLRQQAFAAEAARRQAELVRAAEFARIRAVQEATLFDVAARRRLEENRLRAHQGLLVQARFAIQTKNFGLAVDFFKGAADIVPPQPVVAGFTPQTDVYREMALARAEADRAAKVRAAQVVAARETALRQQREQELAKVRQNLAQQKQATALVQKKAQADRDRQLYQASFDEGQRLYAQGKYEAALSSLQAARRIQATPAVEQLINQTLQQQTLASAKGDTERKQLEAKLAAEKLRRQQAEAEAKRNQELYQGALELANKALAQKQYAMAEAKYNEAGKVFRTDAVMTGLRRVQAARAAETQQAQAESNRAARVKQLLGDGQSALAAKDYGKAIQAYQQAKKLAPENLDVLAGLSQAEAARDKFQAAAAAAKTQAGDAAKKKAAQAASSAKVAQQHQGLLAAAKKALAAGSYDEAVRLLNQANDLIPNDTTGAALLRQARQAQLDQADKAASANKVKDLVSAGQAAIRVNDFVAADKALAAAKKLNPADPGVAQALKQLSAARQAAADAAQRDTDFQNILRVGQKAMQAKNYKAAVQAYQQAAKLRPNDAQVTVLLESAQRELRRAGDVPVPKVEPKKKDEPKFEPKKKDEPKKKADAAVFQELIQEGQKAMQAKKYDEAVRAFSEAQKLRPNNEAVTLLLRQALKLQDDAKDDAKKKKKKSS